MLNRWIKNIFYWLIWGFHRIFSVHIVKHICNLFVVFYNIWCSLEFNKIGKSAYFGRNFTVLGGKFISIGDCVSFGKSCVMTAWEKYDKDIFSPYISIGDNCSFGEYNHITSINHIVIGSGVLTGRWVTITDNSHGLSNYESMSILPVKRNLYSKGPVIIGRNVWIGDKATILPNVTIGDGCIIAANTVVTKSTPPYCIIAGNPGIIIKQIAIE